MKPVILTRVQLLDVLVQISAAVEGNDSFEGSFDYSCLPMEQEEGPPIVLNKDEFFVRATWRVGNSEGQGGLIVIGKDE